MIVEQVNNKKNTVTIIAFILVCVLLNLESIAALFHFSLPPFINTYAAYFPILFVVVIFTQKKNHTIDITNEKLWEAKKKKVLFINSTKIILRYSVIAGVALLFLFPNIYGVRSGFSSSNITILTTLVIAIVITLLYGYLKKGFQVGFCNEGILYGYSSKIMLITWEDIADFELKENTVVIYNKRKMPIQKIILHNKDSYTELKSLVIEKLEYKNVTKLLTDD